jgi:hypothetical protein
MTPHLPARLAVVLASSALSLFLPACEGGTATSERAGPASAEPPASGSIGSIPAEPARVEVTAHGFEPARVSLNFGRQLVFRRTSDKTCATAVVFPELGIEKQLPLNADVTVDVPATAHGEIAFQCGMGMHKSKVVAL